MMKKRVFMIAMAVGILLSLIASVLWAGTPAFSKLDNVVAAYRKKYKVNTTEGSTIKIPVQVQIAVASSAQSGYTAGVADKVKFSVTSSPEGAFESLRLDDPEKSITISDTDTFAFGTILHGTAKGSGTVTITGEALIGINTLGTDTADIVFTTEAGEDEVDSAFMLDGPNDDATKVAPTKVADEADPDNSEKWNGIGSTFGTIGGNGKDKPKVATSKIEFYGNGYAKTNKALKSGVAASFDIEIQGPGPEINVYVSAKDAKKLWPLSCDKKLTKEDKDWEEDIPLTRENIKKWHIPFRVTVASLDSTAPESQDKNTKHTLTIAYNGAQVAYKGFPITVSAANNKTVDNKGNQKPVTKTYKIDIKSDKEVPQWVTATGVVGEKLAKRNAQEISVSLGSGGTLGGTIYTVSADGPYYITSKGDKLGMAADVIQPELNKFGEVVTPGYVKVHGTFDSSSKGTKGGTKETKVAFTLDANGSVKKTTFKPTVIGKVSPYFEAKNLMSGDNKGKETSYAGMPHVKKDDGSYTYDGWYKVKTAEAGKVPSVKFAAKGSKTITYTLTSGGENLEQYGLSFDKKKGQIVQLTNEDGKKVTTQATMNSAYEYNPVEITVVADNGTGHTATAKALVGVTGPKAKVFLGKDDKDKEIKVLSIPQNADIGEYFTIGATIGTTKSMVASTDKSANVHFRLANAKTKKNGREDTGTGEDTYALQQLGLQFIPSDKFDGEFEEYDGKYRNLGVIKVTDHLTATKGTKINLILSNLGNEQKGNVTIAIQDPKPVISGPTDVYITSADTEDKVVEFYLSAGAPTNNAKINWKIANEGTEKAQLKTKRIAVVKDGNTTYQYKATLTLRAKTNATSVTNVMKITAENAESKLKSDEFTVNVHINQEAPTPAPTPDVPEGTTAPKVVGHAGGKAEANKETDAEDENTEDETDETEETEGSVVFGEIRTVEQLTAGQKAFLAEKGYTVVAVLPEVKATADGQYEFEVELDEDAPEGAKLIWLAFPKDAEENEDDKIADFYDESGEAIEEVPAGKVIVVAPWLRADVTYQPVIAVEE